MIEKVRLQRQAANTSECTLMVDEESHKRFVRQSQSLPELIRSKTRITNAKQKINK